MNKDKTLLIENLYCCGNCKFRSAMNNGYSHETCDKSTHSKESSELCTKWEFDGLENIDRLGY